MLTTHQALSYLITYPCNNSRKKVTVGYFPILEITITGPEKHIYLGQSHGDSKWRN